MLLYQITCNCTYYLIDKSNTDNLLTANDIVSIGKTFKNSGVLLVGEEDAVINSPNVEGELCLCGDQLTPGYWKNDKDNAEKFFEKDGTRYYRTGDLCYYAEDGNLMYVSRKDFQVKIRGYRVELGEIEAAAASIARIDYNCCLFDHENEKIILVYTGSIDETEVDHILKTKLQEYMIPARYIHREQMLFSTNGKIDRIALRKEYI